jgi:hypothetical protein
LLILSGNIGKRRARALSYRSPNRGNGKDKTIGSEKSTLANAAVMAVPVMTGQETGRPRNPTSTCGAAREVADASGSHRGFPQLYRLDEGAMGRKEG